VLSVSTASLFPHIVYKVEGFEVLVVQVRLAEKAQDALVA
jgi:hypothetical protein